MRTLGEIIDSVKDGFEPTKDELYYSLLALSALHYFDHSHIQKIVGLGEVGDPNRQKIFAEVYAKDSLKRFKRALEIDPKEYVGWENDPHNPDYQRQRKVFKRIFDKVVSNV